MGIEIERKFLLANDDWRSVVETTIAMGQGYLNDAASVQQGTQNVSVRVRLEGEQARLNIKSREAGASRQEFDYLIPVADGEALLALCVGGRIEKVFFEEGEEAVEGRGGIGHPPSLSNYASAGR